MSQSTYASSIAEGGKLGTLFSRGSGLGNYSITSQSFISVDPANLNAGQNIFIPKGFIAIVSAGGSVNSAVAAVQVAVGIGVDGVLAVEQDITGPGIGQNSNFSLNWVVQGDGNIHNITLMARTSVVADACVILNTTATNAPYLMVEITQSSFLGVSTYGSSVSEARGKLGATLITGSAAGNYSSTTSVFQPVDGGGGQLTMRVQIPLGFALLVAAAGAVGSTGGTAVAVGLLVDGVLKTEQDITPHGTTQLSAFGLSYVVVGDGSIHSIALAYRGTAGGNVTIGNNSATHVPIIMAELTQSNFSGQQVYSSSESEGGKLGVIFLFGGGLGNYASNSQSFVNVDSTLLSQSIVVPKGYVLMIAGAGVAGSATAAVQVGVGITVDGVLVAETDVQGAAAGNLVGFDVQYMIVGDGNAHTVALVFRTNATADNVVIGNSPVTNVPSLLLELTPSNIN